MTIILEGLILGLLLAVSLGPIFIALTQTSLEKGVKPGLTVGSGIWISDFIIVYFVYRFIYIIKSTIESDAFMAWMGISGALVLLVLGVALLIKKPVLDYQSQAIKKLDYLGFWVKGFLVNTINPFTFVFWIGIISSYMIGKAFNHIEMALLLGTILSVIILSDCIKVVLANWLRKWLNEKHVNQISNVSGIILIVFGLVLFLRTM
jgi:threonine/homoserine/homoserine lactone efflux protein